MCLSVLVAKKVAKLSFQRSIVSKIKISVIGAGAVGTACAGALARKDLGSVVLLDIEEGLPRGKALDLAQAQAISGGTSRISSTVDYRETAGSRVVIITAGSPRKPGMSRQDLLEINSAVITKVVQKTAKYSPEAVLILVTNPLDLMCYLAWKTSGFTPERVLGQAGILDSARLRCFLAKELDISPRDVSALTLGGHGDTMVPLIRFATAGGVPVSQLLSRKKLDRIVERTRNGGAEIVSYLRTGSAFQAPGEAAALMAESVIRHQRRILPCSVHLQGEYGLRGIFMGVPVIIGSGGREKIIELKLNREERSAFLKSARAVRAGIKRLRC